MKVLVTLAAAALLSVSMPSNARIAGASQKSPDKPAKGFTSMRIDDEVRHQLLMLPYYGVFDWLECEVQPTGLVLRGEVRRPSNKSDAEAAIRKVDGVSRITNQIEILPVSTTDDQIRIAVYRAVFKYEGPLFRYATQSVPPIHIIVKNGHVTLKGVVEDSGDRQLAYTFANGVPGVFEVVNDLKVVDKG